MCYKLYSRLRWRAAAVPDTLARLYPDADIDACCVKPDVRNPWAEEARLRPQTKSTEARSEQCWSLASDLPGPTSAYKNNLACGNKPSWAIATSATTTLTECLLSGLLELPLQVPEPVDTDVVIAVRHATSSQRAGKTEFRWRQDNMQGSGGLAATPYWRRTCNANT